MYVLLMYSDHRGIHLTAPEPFNRLRNWFAFYCSDRKDTVGLVEDCLGESSSQSLTAVASSDHGSNTTPYYRCFSSTETNWSLNAAMYKKSSMLNKRYKTKSGMKTIAEIGLSHAHQQDGFESYMIYVSKWMDWRIPVCISYNGMFIHEEIETSA